MAASMKKIRFSTFRQISCVSVKLLQNRPYSGRVQAKALIYREYGDPSKVVKSTEMEVEEMASHSVRVKMLAAPINPADINTIQGVYPVKPDLPAVGGFEGVGEVIEIGSEVTHLKPGDLFLPAINTLGDTIIQNAANSGAGQAVIQIAAAQGINSINIIRDRPNVEDVKTRLKSLGASLVLTEEEIRTEEAKVHLKVYPKPKLAFNAVGGKSVINLIKCLQPGGTLVTYGGMSRQPLMVPTGSLIFNDIKFVGYWMTRWHEKNSQSPEARHMINQLCEWAKYDQLQPPQHQQVAFKDYHSAIEKTMEPFTSSKQILRFDL